MEIYIIFGGCIILAIFWMLASLPVKRLGSSVASLVFDAVMTVVVIALFIAGTYSYINQQNRKAAETAVIMESQGSGAGGESVQDAGAGNAQPGSDPGARPSSAETGTEAAAGVSAGAESENAAETAAAETPAQSETTGGQGSVPQSSPVQNESAQSPAAVDPSAVSTGSADAGGSAPAQAGSVSPEISPAAEESTPIQISIPAGSASGN